VQAGPPGETGEAPVHLTGYGGFGISMPAYYNPAIGKLWLERGGTSVIAHLRGGRTGITTAQKSGLSARGTPVSFPA
jgi:hypothetical protein